jgi:hypothetical protein
LYRYSALFAPGFCFGDVVAPEMALGKATKRVGPTRAPQEIDVAEPAVGEDNKRTYVACGAADVRLYDQYPTCFAGRYRREPRVATVSEWAEPATAAAFEAEARKNDAAATAGVGAAEAAEATAAAAAKTIAGGRAMEAVMVDGRNGTSGRSVILRAQAGVEGGGAAAVVATTAEAEAEAAAVAAAVASTGYKTAASAGASRRRGLLSAASKQVTLAAAAAAATASPTEAAAAAAPAAAALAQMQTQQQATRLQQQGIVQDNTQQGEQPQQLVQYYVPITYSIVKQADVNSTYSFPPKTQNPTQTTVYFAKEAPAICPELSSKSLANSGVDYLARLYRVNPVYP